jgi:hypothetical protein
VTKGQNHTTKKGLSKQKKRKISEGTRLYTRVNSTHTKSKSISLQFMFPSALKKAAVVPLTQTIRLKECVL